MLDIYIDSSSKILLRRILKQLKFQNQKLDFIMGATQDLNDKAAELQVTVDDVQARLAASEEANSEYVAQLEANLAAAEAAKVALTAELANSVTPEDTAAAIAQLDATIADIKSTIATPVVPEG